MCELRLPAGMRRQPYFGELALVDRFLRDGIRRRRLSFPSASYNRDNEIKPRGARRSRRHADRSWAIGVGRRLCAMGRGHRWLVAAVYYRTTRQ